MLIGTAHGNAGENQPGLQLAKRKQAISEESERGNNSSMVDKLFYVL